MICVFQVEQWGKVEWYHDVNRLEQQTRLASGTLFVHLNSQETRTSFSKKLKDMPI